MVSKIQSEIISTTSRNTRSKTSPEEKKNKDPNTNVFTDTSGSLFDTLYLDWSRICTIFYNDDLSSITHDQSTYERIHSSQLHYIVARPPCMPYTGPVKWALDYENPKELSFKNNTHTPIALFHSDVFPRAYALGPPR